MQEIGTYLRAALRRKGMTQKQLAMALGMTKEHISTICLNKRRPSLETLEKMCDHLDISLPEFFSDPETPAMLLSKEECQLLFAYRRLYDYEKSGIANLIHALDIGHPDEGGQHNPT